MTGVTAAAFRRTFLRLALGAGALAMVGCGPMPMAGGGGFAGGPVPVALLVPSGSGDTGDEVLALSLENAARLAMDELDGVTVDLRVYRTAGEPAQAASAAAQAVNDGAAIILGPVFADAANAAGRAVAPAGVNVLSFSNNASIAGGNVFVLGQTFQTTADRLASYAVRQGRSRVYVVSEATPAGEIGRAAIQAAVVRAGGQLAGTQTYAFSQEGVVAAVPQIVAGVRGSAADALFLTADTAGALPLFAQLLPEAGLTPSTLQYIGLTRWDIPPATLTLPGVQGGWFALPDPDLNAQFQARYAARYGNAPHPIAGLAYDGIAAIGALVRSGRSDPFSAAALTQGAGFAGVNGVFRLRFDGTNERGLAIAEIRDNQVIVIDPAPRSFAGTGF